MSDDPNLFALLGVQNNLYDPIPNANREGTIIGVTVTILLASWACGIFRFYTRFSIIYSPGWDDFFLVLVLLSSLVGAISICKLPSYGLGQHFLLLGSNTSSYLIGFYIANASYILSTTLIKISLLLQYLRVFQERILRTLCYVLLAITSVWGVVFSILSWVPCIPVYEYWNLTLSDTDKNCFAYGSLTRSGFVRTYLAHAGLNMTLDILVLSLPMYLYFRKNDLSIHRVGLLGLLFGGFVVVFISIWRLATLVEHQATTYPTFDPSWYSPVSIILSAAEVNLASICASVPVFWPVLSDSIGEIFVTKEVHITRERRGDEFELHRNRSGSDVTTGDEYSIDLHDGSMRGGPARAVSQRSPV